jgi:hypothetical protein
MKIEFNKNRYLKLLKEKKIFEKQGKLFRDYEKIKNDELISYIGWLGDQVFWENRKEYLQILNLFVSKKITPPQFFEQFFALRCSNLRSITTLIKKLEEEIFVLKSNEIDITVNPKCYEFTDIISYVHSLVDLSDSDITLEMDLKNPELIYYGMSEESLRLQIEENILPELKKYCEKSKISHNIFLRTIKKNLFFSFPRPKNIERIIRNSFVLL